LPAPRYLAGTFFLKDLFSGTLDEQFGQCSARTCHGRFAQVHFEEVRFDAGDFELHFLGMRTSDQEDKFPLHSATAIDCAMSNTPVSLLQPGPTMETSPTEPNKGRSISGAAFKFVLRRILCEIALEATPILALREPGRRWWRPFPSQAHRPTGARSPPGSTFPGSDPRVGALRS